MSWLPRFSIGGWCACEADAEFEGFCLEVRWLGYLVEFAFARQEPSPQQHADTAIAGGAPSSFRWRLEPEASDDAR